MAGAQGGKGCGRRRDGWGQTGLSTLGNLEHQAGAVSFLWHQESLQNFNQGSAEMETVLYADASSGNWCTGGGLMGKKGVSWEVGVTIQV